MTLPSSTEKNHAAARLSIMFNNTTTALARSTETARRYYFYGVLQQTKEPGNARPE